MHFGKNPGHIAINYKKHLLILNAMSDSQIKIYFRWRWSFKKSVIDATVLTPRIDSEC